MTHQPTVTAELRKLLEEGTPGPWMVADRSVREHGAEVASIESGVSVVRPLDDSLIEPGDPKADAALIAAAVNALPMLLDVVEAARAFDDAQRAYNAHIARPDKPENPDLDDPAVAAEWFGPWHRAVEANRRFRESLEALETP